MLTIRRSIFILAAIASFLTISLSYASSATLAPASEIKGLTQAIEIIKSQSKHPVPFPVRVPKSDKLLYAVQSSYEKPNYNEYWMITITTDPKCVAKGCVVGSLSASSTDKLDFDYLQAPFDKNMKPIPKDKVNMGRGITAYFTPGHAEADWHPPTLEWQQDGILYHFSWDLGKDAKQLFVTMMQSQTP